MGFRFHKSFRAGPARLNISKSGIGYSAGVKGFRVTKQADGKTRKTVSLPGTGISYVTTSGKKKGQSVQDASRSRGGIEGKEHTSMGLFHREIPVISSGDNGRSPSGGTGNGGKKGGIKLYHIIIGLLVLAVIGYAAGGSNHQEDSRGVPTADAVAEVTQAETPTEAEPPTEAETEAPTEPVTEVPAVTAPIHGTDRTVSLPEGTLVWLSATGEKFHKVNDCGNMNPDKARQVTVEEAVAEGHDACENCYE